MQNNDRITAGNSTREYAEDDPQYCVFLGINHREDDSTRALPSQFRQADRANRQPLATLSAAAVNRLRQAATPAAVATNATTTRAQAQQQRLVMEEPKPRQLLYSIVINNEPFLLDRPPTPLLNYNSLNQLGPGDTSTGRSSPFTGPSQHRHTTSLMQECLTEDISTDEEPMSTEEDMGDDGEEREMEEWEREGAHARSMDEMAEDIRRTPTHKRTEVLSPVVLAEQRKKSPPTCKPHFEQAAV